MKYSFMSFSCPELTFPELLEVAKKYGYDGIEPRTNANHKHGIEFDASPEFRARCKEQAATSDIQIACLATSCRYADLTNVAEHVEDTHEAIDLAADLGCSRIRVFGGPIPEGTTREAAIKQVAAALKSLTDHAAERKVVLCMEAHDDWCDPNHLKAVMEQVNHPAIAVNWDIMHPVRAAKVSMTDAFEILRPWIKHVHFHDGVTEPDNSATLTPIGWGDIDHRTAVQLLKDDNYTDFLSGEWINWEDFEIHLPREINTMRCYENEKSSC